MTIELRTMTEREARVITERIRISAHNYTEARTKLMQHVQEAKDGNAHDVLGYASWTAYLAEVLGEEPMRLARDERQDMVRMLANEGMPTRAIAAITDIPRSTVSDLNSGVRNRTPEPATVAITNAVAPDVIGVEPEREGFSTAHPPRITGMDGKKYKRPEPKPEPEPTQQAPRPDSLTKQFSGAASELNRVLDRFYRIRENKNFARNKEQIATLHGSDLQRAISELQTLADALN